MAGFATLHIPEGVATQPNVTIHMLHAEAIRGPPQNNSAIFQHYGCSEGSRAGSLKGCMELNTYITKGGGAAVSYRPHFTYIRIARLCILYSNPCCSASLWYCCRYAGFRYIELRGYPGIPDRSTLTAHFVHTAYEHTGDISFSDSQLSAVQHITRAAAKSNFQSVPTDCPQRERRGWLGDAQLSAETNLYNFGMAAPYTSFVQQINDAQDKVPKWFTVQEGNGSVPDTCPFYGHGRQPADPAWGAAYTLISDWVATWYDDDRIFMEHYQGIKAHVDQLIHVAKSNNYGGLLTYGLYSDWCPPTTGCGGFSPGNHSADPSGLQPPPDVTNSMIVSSFYYIHQLRIVAKYAKRLGLAQDAARYTAVEAPLPLAFNAKFLLVQGGNATYREIPAPRQALSVQTTISMAYRLGVIPPQHLQACVKTLVDDVAAHGYHVNTGIVGIKFLLPFLSETGHADVALMVAQVRTPPSYIYMVEQGATTLWETWNSLRYSPGGTPASPAPHASVPSWNHIMFGAISEWFFKALGGITQAVESRGWERIVLRPRVWSTASNRSVCANLSSAAATVLTPRGKLSSSWRCATKPKPPSPYPAASDNCVMSNSSGKLGGNVVEDWGVPRSREQGTLTMTCTDGGTIKAIDFASFGLPECLDSTGARIQCANSKWHPGTCSKGGFKTSEKCNAPTSLAASQKACVGKKSCTLLVSTATFGGKDPCPSTTKSLAVVASGCTGVSTIGPAAKPPPPAGARFTYDVTVPVSATAAVHVPTFGSAAAELLVTESDAPLWTAGKLVPAVSGVLSATLNEQDAELVVVVGSGSYKFKLLKTDDNSLELQATPLSPACAQAVKAMNVSMDAAESAYVAAQAPSKCLSKCIPPACKNGQACDCDCTTGAAAKSYAAACEQSRSTDGRVFVQLKQMRWALSKKLLDTKRPLCYPTDCTAQDMASLRNASSRAFCSTMGLFLLDECEITLGF